MQSSLWRRLTSEILPFAKRSIVVGAPPRTKSTKRRRSDSSRFIKSFADPGSRSGRRTHRLAALTCLGCLCVNGGWTLPIQAHLKVHSHKNTHKFLSVETNGPRTFL